jgi:GNAT superfamily N-acetyltransferase
MSLKYEIIHNKDILVSHRKTFVELLEKQGKVKGNLYEKADRCKFICIVSIDNIKVSIGGIKPKTTSDFESDKADLSGLENAFDWELGYIYTDKAYSGKGIAGQVVKLLLEEFGIGNLMASTEITANPMMVKILENNGFRHYGTPWKSGIHNNRLGLFLRFK